MKTIEVDQFEFDNPQTEEHLQIATARRSEWVPTVAAFAASVGCGNLSPAILPKGRVDDLAGALAGLAPTLPASQPLNAILGHRQVLSYLKRFAGIDAPEPCDWACWPIPNDEHFIEEKLLIETDDSFISYKWSTSA